MLGLAGDAAAGAATATATATATVTADGAALDVTPGGPAPTRRQGLVAIVGFALVSVVAFVVAVRLSLDVVVFGLLVFGVAHLGFEIRYVTGRYRPLLNGRVLVGVSAALLLIVAGRLVAGGTWWTPTEIVLLAGALGWVLLVQEADPRRRAAGVGGLVAISLVALWFSSVWLVTQAWLHNLIPVVFLWVWSRRLPGSRARRLFRAVTLMWVVAVPALLLAGVADGWLRAGSTGADQIARAGGLRATVVPTAWQGDVITARLLAAFAFLQLLHYAVWIWHFPRADRAATAVFESTVIGGALRSWRLPALLVGVSAILALVAWFDYRSGRGMYTSMAAFHAYLEYTVLLALAVGAPAVRRSVATGVAA